MYVCNRCGELCDEDDLPTYTEDFGYDTGVGWRSCPQTFVDNCSCGGDFVKADRCSVCDEYFCSELSKTGNVCDVCLEENADFDNAIECGKEWRDAIELNGFLVHSFTQEQIEEILLKELKVARQVDATKIDKEAKDYCLEDEGCFADWLESQNKPPKQ